MVTNFENHMKTEKIRDLRDAGFIQIDEANVAKLETPVYINGQWVKIGDLTISDFANYALALI